MDRSVGPSRAEHSGRLSGWLEQIRRVLEVSTKAICVGALVVVAFTLGAGVFFRYIVGQGPPFTGVLPLALFPWLIMSGAVMAAVRRRHLAVDYFLLKLPRRPRRFVSLATKLLVVIVFVAVVAISLNILPLVGNRVIPVLNISASWVFLSIPLGFAGLTLCSAMDFLEEFALGESASPESGFEGSEQRSREGIA